MSANNPRKIQFLLQLERKSKKVVNPIDTVFGPCVDINIQNTFHIKL